MARIVKNRQEWHKVTMKEGEKSIVLVGTGRRAYLWVGSPVDFYQTFRGQKTLIKFAEKILENVKP